MVYYVLCRPFSRRPDFRRLCQKCAIEKSQTDICFNNRSDREPETEYWSAGSRCQKQLRQLHPDHGCPKDKYGSRRIGVQTGEEEIRIRTCHEYRSVQFPVGSDHSTVQLPECAV